MKKAMTALFTTTTAAATSAFAADRTDVPVPVADDGVRPPLEMGRGPLPPFPPQPPPHRPMLFSVTVATDTPAETINKLTTPIPASPAKHYEVHVEVAPVTGDIDGQQPLRRLPDLGTAIEKAAVYRGSFVNKNETEWQRINCALSDR